MAAITNGILLNVLLNTGSPNGQYTIERIKPSIAVRRCCRTSLARERRRRRARTTWRRTCRTRMVHEFDLIVQQQMGRGTVFSVSYLGALGRELPNFLDLNLDPTT